MPFGVGSAPLVAQSKINSQLRIYLPVVLDIEGRFQRLVCNRFEHREAAAARIAIAQKQTRKELPSIGTAIPNDLLGLALCEVKKARRRIGLEEIIEELPLLAAKLQYVSALDPG